MIIGLAVFLLFGEIYPGLEMGPHPVGFTSMLLTDRSRPFGFGEEGEALPGRPVQLNVWYPARGDGNAMTYGDYVALVNTETPAAFHEYPNTDARGKFTAYSNRAGRKYEPDQIDTLFAMAVAARRDATWASGRFPLVLSGGAFRAYGNPVLCEYLASRGFIVVAPPSVGPVTQKPEFNALQVETAARDLAFVMAVSLERFPVDADRIASVNFSFTTRASFALACRDPRIKALVHMEGWDGYQVGNRAFDQELAQKAGELRAPLLHLTADLAHGDKDFTVFESFRYSQRVLVEVSTFRHIDFLSIAGWFHTEVSRASKEKFIAVQIYIADYLAATLNRDPEAEARLNAYTSGGSQHLGFLKRTDFHGLPAPPDEYRLAARMGEEGGVVQAAREMLAAGKREPGRELYREAAVNYVGYQVMVAGDLDLARALFVWNTEIFPHSANVWDSLAELELKAGNHEKAKALYQEVLEREPSNQHAAEVLKNLSNQSDL